MKLSAWRAALRIARRDALRAKGRSALVLAMIALPVLGVAGADVVYRSAELTPQQKATRLMGGSDALISVYARGFTVLQSPDAEEGTTVRGPVEGRPPTAEQQKSLDTEPAELLRQLLPPGSTLLPLASGSGGLASTRDGQLRVDTDEVDLTDPVWRGKIDVIRGRAPSAPGEIAVTRAFLAKSGLRLGDTTTVRGLERTPFTLTAEVEYPGDLGAVQLIGRPGALIAPLRHAEGSEPDGNALNSGGSWLLRLPPGASLDWSAVRKLDDYGFAATSRSVLLHPPHRAEVPYYAEQDRRGGRVGYLDQRTVVVGATAAGMALLEVVLLAGPAFAVGARRSRRQLGLIAAGGGDRGHIRAVVLGGGVVLGLAGAVIGVVLAALLVAAGRPWLEDLTGRRFGGFGLVPLDLLAIALLGLVTGLLAAIVPALQAARQDVLAALTGRDAVRPPARRLAVLGLLMVAGGAALALLGAEGGLVNRSAAVLGGSVVAELGMVALTPMLVGLLGRLGRWLPLSPRLALRDAVRHRGRTAPAVAAVMAAVAGSVAVGIYGSSIDAQDRQDYVAGLPSGAVQLFTGYGSHRDPAQLPQLTAAVEQSMPALGARGDVFDTVYPAGCSGRSCGAVQPVIPPERRCPASEESGPGRHLDPAEFDRLMREDPRCARTRQAGSYFGQLPAGDATTLRNLFGVRDQAAAQALAEGKVVVFDPRYLKDGKVILELTEPFDSSKPYNPTAVKPAARQLTADAVAVTPEIGSTSSAFLTPQTAQRLGLGSVPAGAVWLPDAAPGDAAEQKATAAVSKADPDSMLTVERGYRPQYDLTIVGLTVFAAIVALGAAGIATGLAAADSQRDLATLAAVGAHGGIRRRLSGFQCGVIAAAGAVLGTACGFVPAVALRKLGTVTSAPFGADRTDPSVLAIPWSQIGLTLVGIPLLAVLLAMLFTRSRIGLTRRTV